MKPSRGRPRQFDENTALEAAGNVFWTNGFSATSLDDLADAMGMNRPSIYGAFGDKEALYRRALQQFGSRMEAAMRRTLQAKSDVRNALMSFYREALAVYLSGPQAKGCLVMSTAVSVSVNHPEVQADLLEVIKTIDKSLEERFQQGINSGELAPEFDVSSRAAVAQSVLHSLSLRARAGDTKSNLNRLIRSGVELVLS